MPAKPRSRPIVIAIEGFDGAGKSTLAEGLKRHFDAIGSSTQVVGKRLDEADIPTDLITNILMQVEGRRLQVHDMTHMHLRLARLHARLALAHGEANVYIMDRWVLSELTYMSLHSESTAGHLVDELDGLAANITLFLKCSFDVSWSRVQARGNALTPKQALGAEWNEHIFDRLQRFAVHPPDVVGKIVALDATRPVESVLESALEVLESARATPIRSRQLS